MKTQLHNFETRQREMIAKLLVQAKARAQEELESDDDVNSRVKEEMIPKLVEQFGASELVEKVQRLHKEHETAETALRKTGFYCCEEDIHIEYNPPKALSNALESAQRSARKERDQVLRKYDQAVLTVLTSEDVGEARKIAEGLL